MRLELVQIIRICEQSDYKLLDLNTVALLASSSIFQRSCAGDEGFDSLLQILERILQKVRHVLLQKFLVGRANRGLVRGIDRFLDLSGFDKIEHARE